MKLRTNLLTREVVRAAENPAIPSPEPGVTRYLLERDGNEVARATSLVHYAAQSSFPAHVHDKGEELLVLQGIFEDEHGQYPEGTYVRNPPGSRHRPFSREGCLIFVKLRQFAPGDDARILWPPTEVVWDLRAGVRVGRLHTYGLEEVSLVEMEPSATLALNTRAAGIELLVLGGQAEVDGSLLSHHDWLRTPATKASIQTTLGCRLWLKTGHLEPLGFAHA